MMRVCFICLGNICRSPMAEFIMKKKVKHDEYIIESRATSYEEQGNDMYRPAKKKLIEEGIPFTKHSAKCLEKEDYDKFDIFYCMEDSNIRNTLIIFGSDPENKVHKLLPKDIDDPWYTNDFDTTYDELVEGINNIINKKVS